MDIISGGAVPQQELFTVAEAFLHSLRNKDWSLLRSILTADCSWSLPGTSVISGEAVGAEAVTGRAVSLRAYGVNFELLHVLYGMYGVALSLHNTASRGDLVLNEYVAIVLMVKNGKITRITTLLSDVQGLNSFFI